MKGTLLNKKGKWVIEYLVEHPYCGEHKEIPLDIQQQEEFDSCWSNKRHNEVEFEIIEDWIEPKNCVEKDEYPLHIFFARIIKKDIYSVFCEHANEVPGKCNCPDTCYCKSNTCFNKKEGTIPIKETFEYKEALRIINKANDSSWINIFYEFLDSDEYKNINPNNKIITYSKWLSENYNAPTKK